MVFWYVFFPVPGPGPVPVPVPVPVPGPGPGPGPGHGTHTLAVGAGVAVVGVEGVAGACAGAGAGVATSYAFLKVLCTVGDEVPNVKPVVDRPNVRGKEEVCRVSLGRPGLLVPGVVGDVEGRGVMGTTSMVGCSRSQVRMSLGKVDVEKDERIKNER